MAKHSPRRKPYSIGKMGFGFSEECREPVPLMFLSPNVNSLPLGSSGSVDSLGSVVGTILALTSAPFGFLLCILGGAERCGALLGGSTSTGTSLAWLVGGCDLLGGGGLVAGEQSASDIFSKQFNNH